MSSFPIYQFIFYVFAGILLLASFMVIISRNPVHAVLFLILAFFASSVLWLMMQAEFLALVLIFVYVGAVMTLFLFVVMMLNIKIISSEGFVKYIPFAVITMVIFVGMLVLILNQGHLGQGVELPHLTSTYSNVSQLGMLLYTRYLYPLEVTGAILLTAIVSAIVLAFSGRKPGTKAQNVPAQLAVTKASRLRIVDGEGDLS